MKRKPYVQANDEDCRPDEEVADEYWQNHLSRNDSIIVDLCQVIFVLIDPGNLLEKSCFNCPVCF